MLQFATMGWKEPGGKSFLQALQGLQQLQQVLNPASFLGRGVQGGNGSSGGGKAGQGPRKPAAKTKDKAKTKWQCLCSDCEGAVAARWNFAANTACRWCSKPKGEALNPPRALSLKAPGSAADRAKAASVGAAGNPAASGAGAVPKLTPQQPQSAGAVAPTGSAIADGERLALSADFVAGAVDLMQALQWLVDSLAEDTLPRWHSTPLSAEATCDDMLAESQPLSTAAELAGAEAELTRLRGLRAQVVDAAEVKHFDARIASVSATVVGLTKKSPDAAQQAASLQTAKGRFAERMLKVDRNVAELAAKAAERRRVRAERLQAMQQLLVDALAEIARVEEAHLSAHAAQAVARKAHDDCVKQIFDDRIAAAICGSAAVTGASKPMISPVVGAAEARPAAPSTAADGATTNVLLEKALADGAALRDRLAQLEQKIAEGEIEAQRTAALESTIHPPPPLLLPPMLGVPTADKTQTGILTKLSYLLAEWGNRGSSTPFTYGELQAMAVTPDIIKGLLGAAWDLFYPEGPPREADVVPRQVAHYTLQALVSLQLSGSPSAEAKREVDDGLEGIAKKMRR